MQEIIGWVITNWGTIIEGYFALVGLAAFVVKLTPTLRDDHYLKEVIKFVGRFIALGKYGPSKEDMKEAI